MEVKGTFREDIDIIRVFTDNGLRFPEDRVEEFKDLGYREK